MLYLDSASTTFPRPSAVAAAMVEYLETAGSPGRSAHALSRVADEYLWRARSQLATLLNAPSAEHVVFSLNATMSLNAVVGHLAARPGRVLISGFEHNSVTRPLHVAAQRGQLTYSVIPPSADQPIDLDHLEDELRTGTVTGVILTWVSNVTGAVMPIADASALCRRYGVFLGVDAAQAVGHLPVDASYADAVIFAGHKGLGGPQGVGGAILRDGCTLTPFVVGGSGGRSERPDHPRWLPWSQEAGTANGVGIAGLAGALALLDHDEIVQRAAKLDETVALLRHGLLDVDGVEIIDGLGPHRAAGIVSIRVAGASPAIFAARLEEDFSILVRAGLHCAPLAHRTIGTADGGTIRFSVSHVVDQSQISRTIEAVGHLAPLFLKERTP